jgi:glyoxylase-like metal-dependent hydrolase (beta-lactamase superfamily II)
MVLMLRILDCASMSPRFLHWEVGTPCLLVGTHQGLVLVDTGLGLHDYLQPSPMVRTFRRILGIEDNPEHAAVRQLVQLGVRPESVRHIVMTHLHFDHAGGLPDFPHAQVHVHRREVDAMQHPRGWMELAYDRDDFRPPPDWVLYETPTEEWLGFDAIRLPFTPEMLLIPLFGHTRGHCGVAVRDGDGWLFQCTDAVPTNAQFDLMPSWVNRLVIGPHVDRIRDCAASHPDVRVLAGHMWRSSFDLP